MALMACSTFESGHAMRVLARLPNLRPFAVAVNSPIRLLQSVEQLNELSLNANMNGAPGSESVASLFISATFHSPFSMSAVAAGSR